MNNKTPASLRTTFMSLSKVIFSAVLLYLHQRLSAQSYPTRMNVKVIRFMSSSTLHVRYLLSDLFWFGLLISLVSVFHLVRYAKLCFKFQCLERLVFDMTCFDWNVTPLTRSHIMFQVIFQTYRSIVSNAQ